MARGLSAAAAAASGAGPSGADVVTAAALAFSDAAGGASGALWGAGLLAFGRALRPPSGTSDSGAEPTLDVAAVQRALVAALEAVTRLGGAKPGDKTMVDALVPFVDAFGASVGASVASAWSAAARVAEQAAAGTADLAARKGRAAIHGDQSKGTPDPGAVSLAVALVAAGGSIRRSCAPDESGRP